MSIQLAVERFAGAYATPRLVGRSHIRKQIRDLLEAPSSQSRVIFLTGEGGIGKTRLLHESLEMARAVKDVRSAHSIIDLYHVQHHTASGLADAMYKVLVDEAHPFENYEQARRRLERMRLAGDVGRTAIQRKETLEAFSHDLRALTQRKRVVIALDTAERLVYGINQLPESIMEIVEAWDWLLNSLQTWNNAVLLIAGREETEPLRKQLRNSIKGNLIEEQVKPFTEQDTLDYFDAVAQTAEEAGEHDISTRVKGLGEELRRTAHIYSGGRPILLALIIDHLSIASADRLPFALRTSVEEASVKSQAELVEIQNDLGKQLIGRLKESSIFGDMIVTLGRLPKGANKELVAQLLGITHEEAQDRLSDMKRLSFVKVRPEDERVFLHDEMYTLLRRQIFDSPDDAPQAAEAMGAILSYYEDQLNSCLQELNDIYAPVEDPDRGELPAYGLEELTRLHARRRDLLTEDLYYRLRQNAIRGFRLYYRNMQEAIVSGDTSLDVQLEVEVLTFLNERDPNRRSENIDSLERRWVDAVMALRPVVRAWAAAEYQSVLEEARKLREKSADVLAADAPITDAILNAWEAYARIYLGGKENITAARVELDAAIDSLKPLVKSEKDESTFTTARLWRARSVLAFAYRVSGYLYRVRGLMKDAVKDYRNAATFSREVNVQIELATTLNDMGFAMAELGDFADGRAVVSDALEIRRQLGSRSLVGLSLNTLAFIDLEEGAYSSAVERSRSAVVLFRALENRRGAGLALIRSAEALRRHSGSADMLNFEEKVKFLREARDNAREALTIFDQSGETIRQAQALIEQGCACRHWAALLLSQPESQDNTDDLIVEGERALRLAAELAGDAILYLKVDALVNLAWLGYISGRDDLLESVTAQVKAAIPSDYYISKDSGQPKVQDKHAQVSLWPQLGKLYTLYGHRAIDSVDKISDMGKRKLMVEETATQYLWALQYSSLHSKDYPNLRRAKEEIYTRLKKLSPAQWKDVENRVRSLEGEYNLGDSEMRRFLQNRALWYGE